MANELKTPGISGATLYAVLFDADGLVWQTTTSTFVAFVAGNWANYDIALAEKSTTGIFFGDLPGTLDTDVKYPFFVFERVSGAPAVTDTLLGGGDVGEAFDPAVHTVDGVTYAEAIRSLMATAFGVSTVDEGEVTFMRRDGVTPGVIVNLSGIAGVRISSSIE